MGEILLAFSLVTLVFVVLYINREKSKNANKIKRQSENERKKSLNNTPRRGESIGNLNQSDIYTNGFNQTNYNEFNSPFKSSNPKYYKIKNINYNNISHISPINNYSIKKDENIDNNLNKTTPLVDNFTFYEDPDGQNFIKQKNLIGNSQTNKNSFCDCINIKRISGVCNINGEINKNGENETTYKNFNLEMKNKIKDNKDIFEFKNELCEINQSLNPDKNCKVYLNKIKDVSYYTSKHKKFNDEKILNSDNRDLKKITSTADRHKMKMENLTENKGKKLSDLIKNCSELKKKLSFSSINPSNSVENIGFDSIHLSVKKNEQRNEDIKKNDDKLEFALNTPIKMNKNPRGFSFSEMDNDNTLELKNDIGDEVIENRKNEKSNQDISDSDENKGEYKENFIKKLETPNKKTVNKISNRLTNLNEENKIFTPTKISDENKSLDYLNLIFGDGANSKENEIKDKKIIKKKCLDSENKENRSDLANHSENKNKSVNVFQELIRKRSINLEFTNENNCDKKNTFGLSCIKEEEKSLEIESAKKTSFLNFIPQFTPFKKDPQTSNFLLCSSFKEE